MGKLNMDLLKGVEDQENVIDKNKENSRQQAAQSRESVIKQTSQKVRPKKNRVEIGHIRSQRSRRFLSGQNSRK